MLGLSPARQPRRQRQIVTARDNPSIPIGLRYYVEPMRSVLSLILCCACLAATDEEYRRNADAYLDGYFAWRPETAVSMGLHQYDGKAADFSRGSIKNEREAL